MTDRDEAFIEEGDLDPIIVDGSKEEGGGQMLRDTLAWSVLMARPIKIINIRAGRTQPGLRPQHLTSVNLVADLCSAKKIEGNEIGSLTVLLNPGCPLTGSYSAVVKTAGSTTLMVQSVLPICSFATIRGAKRNKPRKRTNIKLGGGTDVGFSPPADYVIHVLAEALTKFGLQMELRVARRGVFPRGGGELELSVRSQCGYGPLKPVELVDCGSWTQITASIRVVSTAKDAKKFSRIGQVCAETLEKRLRATFPDLCHDGAGEVALHADQSSSSCIVALVVVKTSNGCVFGADRLISKEQEVSASLSDLVAELKRYRSTEVCVDDHLQDQLIIFMALANGVSTVKVSYPLTKHTISSMGIAEQLSGCSFSVTPEAGKDTALLACTGINYYKD